MLRGAMSVELDSSVKLSAPPSGLHLGRGENGPVTLRLFRPIGTRVVVAGGVLPARLLVLRAASIGAAVRIVSNRDWIWSSAAAHGADTRVVPVGQRVPPVPTPTVVVNDRQDVDPGQGELTPWHCRMDIRSPGDVAELTRLTQFDLVVLGALPTQLALSAASVLGFATTHAGRLSSLRQGEVLVTRRGVVEFVQLDPTEDERRVLAR